MDGRALGYGGKNSHVGLKARLEKLFEKGAFTPAEIKKIKTGYPGVKWGSLPPETTLRRAWEEGMSADEIAIELSVPKGKLRAKFQEMRRASGGKAKGKGLDDTRRVPREEFLDAVRGAPSLADAANALGLSETAVLRRAGRYMNMGELELESADNVRWEEAHMPETLPADSPAAVLCAVKTLAARFENSARDPNLKDIAEHLRIPLKRAGDHFELLVAQGLLEREVLATPEVAA